MWCSPLGFYLSDDLLSPGMWQKKFLWPGRRRQQVPPKWVSVPDYTLSQWSSQPMLWGPQMSQIFKFTSNSIFKGRCTLALQRPCIFCAFFNNLLSVVFDSIVCILSRNENTINVLENGAAFFIVQTLRVIYQKTRQWGSKINLTTWCTLPPVNHHLWEKSEWGRLIL